MKKIVLYIITVSYLISCTEQGVQQKVVHSSGTFVEGNNINISDTQTIEVHKNAQEVTSSVKMYPKKAVARPKPRPLPSLEPRRGSTLGENTKSSGPMPGMEKPTGMQKSTKPQTPIHKGVKVVKIKPATNNNRQDTISKTDNTIEKNADSTKAQKIVIKKQKQLRFAFKVPDSMEIEESYEVLFRLTKIDDTTYEMVTKSERKEFRFDSAEVILPVVKKVKVVLIDPTNKNFEIRNNNNDHDEQFIPEIEHAEWSWFVTPLKSGKGTLVFTGSFIDDSHNDKKVSNRKFYQKPIIVTTSPGYYANSVAGFFSDNWQWLIDNFFAAFGGIGGFAAIVWAFMRKKKKKEETKSSDKESDSS